MEDYPTTMLEFEKFFATEQSCQEYLYQMRWPSGFICPHCNYREYWLRENGQYQCKSCRFRISATTGTMAVGVKKLHPQYVVVVVVKRITLLIFLTFIRLKNWSGLPGNLKNTMGSLYHSRTLFSCRSKSTLPGR